MEYIDRMHPLTVLLDDVFYKSSITDMRNSLFNGIEHGKSWLLFSDYYLENEKTNKVITFTAMPHFADFMEIQNKIKSISPKDIKHTRSVNEDFINLINSLPIINTVFILQKKKYFLWDTADEVCESLFQYVETLSVYVSYWRTMERTQNRLDKISKNLLCLKNLLENRKKLKIIASMFLISLLGGYVGSLIFREAHLTTLTWLSDRDSTNEICNNLIRDLFQITLIDVTKKNIQFNFTTANSDSEEWYDGLTRIPDYITGTIANYDFDKNLSRDFKFNKMLHLHFRNNIENTYLFRFIVDEERIRLRRQLIL